LGGIRADTTVIIDIGFDAVEAGRRGHEFLRHPIEILAALRVDAAVAPTLALTHLHYDHIGNLACFPNATVHVQADELAFVTGPYMGLPRYNRAYRADHVDAVMAARDDGRLVLLEGDGEIVSGLSVHPVGGHTAGMQVVRVFTSRGWIVLASDAIHYYEELERGVPWTNVMDIPAMLAAHGRMYDLADSDDHIVAAHDPRVLDLYPMIEGLDGYAVSRHAVPNSNGR